MIEGFEGHLAVEDRHPRHPLQLIQQLLGVQWLIVLHGQPFQRPMAVLVLTGAQLQAAQLHAGKPHIAIEQAGPDIGHHLHVVQPQGTAALADHHVVRQQHWRHALPAAFKAANGQRHAQGITGLGLDFCAVFGNQRRQLTTQADVERRKYQNQRT